MYRLLNHVLASLLYITLSSAQTTIYPHAKLITQISEAIETDTDVEQIRILLSKGYQSADSLQDNVMRAELLVLESEALKKQKEDDQAIELIFDAIKIYEEEEDYIKASENLYKVGGHYFYRGEHDKSLQYITAAIDVLPDGEKYSALKPKIYTAIGTINAQLGNFEASLSNHNKALRIKQELKLVDQIPVSLSNMGHTNLGIGDTTKALELLQRASFLGDSLKLHKDVLFAEFSLGAIYHDMGRYPASVPKLEFAVAEYEKLDTDFDLVSAYPKLASVYDKLGRYREANDILNKFIELRQRMFDESKVAISEELEKQYQTEKKVQENQYLKTQNEDHLRQRSIYIVGLLTLVGLLGLIARSYVQMRRVKQKIDKQKNTIQQQADELQELDNLKSRFFANVSHELRTPLSLILGPVNTLLNGSEHTDRDRNLLMFIRRNATQLKKLVNEILDLSKLENHRLELLEEPVELYSLMRHHITRHFIIDQNINIKFELDLDSDKHHPLTINLDSDKFLKIINNLVSNAVKYNKPDGSVKIGIDEGEKEITIYVNDTGKGIAPDELSNVFDRYYMSQRDRHHEGGTGIGLAFSKELALLLGGSLTVESTIDVGSTFYLTIPKKSTEETPVDIASESSIHLGPDNLEGAVSISSSNGHLRRLLIAEDNPELREYYRIILPDYNIHTVSNGREALQFLEQEKNKPDLIISDVMMPEVDGLELLDHLKSDSNYRHIPVILVTARTDRYIKINALRVGLDDYLSKPFDEEELRVRVHNLITNYDAREDEEVSTVKINDADAQWLNQIESYITDHISDHLLSVGMLTTEFAMSESTLRRQLKRLTGLGPSKYLQEHKLDKSRSLLEKKQYRTIAEVAYHSGFRDAKSFSRSFKSRYGRSPSAYLSE